MNSLRTFFRTRRTVRRHLTRSGLYLPLLLAGLFFEAYMHNFNLVYIALFLLIGTIPAAGMAATLNVGEVRAACKECGRLFARRPGACRFEIANDGDTTAWGVDLVCDRTRQPLPPLAPRSRLTVSLAVTPARRGRWSPGTCRLESLYPLGTIRVEKPADTRCRALVYPEPKGRPLESFLRRVRSRAGTENDFEGLEAYTGAQAPSRIHWPSVAKGEPMAKRFEREEEVRTLHFDFESAGADDEARLSQLTLWVLACERRGLPFTLRLRERTMSSRKEGVDAILDALATY